MGTALELLAQMKAHNIRPNAVTYAAVVVSPPPAPSRPRALVRVCAVCAWHAQPIGRRRRAASRGRVASCGRVAPRPRCGLRAHAGRLAEMQDADATCNMQMQHATCRCRCKMQMQMQDADADADANVAWVCVYVCAVSCVRAASCVRACACACTASPPPRAQDVCCKCGDLARAEATIAEMGAHSAPPDAITYNMLLHACCKYQQPQRLFATLSKMRGAGI
eukprot:5433917-Prymnesium_polylepis.1